jgi:hypothetical protein
MNDNEVKAFCKSLKVDDIIKANYDYGGVTREIIGIVIKLNNACLRTTIKCIMDTSNDVIHTPLIGKELRIEQFSKNKWKYQIL